ncbi:DUF455 family protein [Streptomyces aureus]|uniref:DUF455 family protein n=1 Tax=Streptomyces aureus TaxID=193461 RepID=UPI0033FF48D3
MKSQKQPRIDPEFLINRRGLQALLFSSIKLMEISASVIVRTESLPWKLGLSHNVWALAQTAQLLHTRIGSLRVKEVRPCPATRAYRDFIDRIANLSDPVSEMGVLARLAYPDLKASVDRYRARLLSTDEVTADCLDQVSARLTALYSADIAPASLSPEFAETLARSGGAVPAADAFREEMHPGPAEESFTADLNSLRVIPARPGRSSQFTEAKDGSTKETASGYGPAFYDFAFRIELCATEICAAMLAHYVDAPWGLRHDLAKQLRDEARHFELFISRAEELGTKLGALPVRFEVWDNFMLGESLAERLIIEQRIGEGIALDSADDIYARLKASGEEELALVFQYVTADEITHVANGNKWLRSLLGTDDAVDALEKKVMNRLIRHKEGRVYKHPINVENRRLAGFHEDEIESIRREQSFDGSDADA